MNKKMYTKTNTSFYLKNFFPKVVPIKFEKVTKTYAAKQYQSKYRNCKIKTHSLID